MILILTSEKDASTNHIIDWLSFYNAEYVRINETTEIKLLEFTLSDDKTDIILGLTYTRQKKLNKIINLRDVNSYWYRRGNFNIEQKRVNCSNSNLEKDLNSYLDRQDIYLVDFLHLFLKNKPNVINSFHDNNTNKLNNLFQAKKAGLKIPQTHIVNEVSSLKRLQKKNQ